jgi:hypothetical protein
MFMFFGDSIKVAVDRLNKQMTKDEGPKFLLSQNTNILEMIANGLGC